MQDTITQLPMNTFIVPSNNNTITKEGVVTELRKQGKRENKGRGAKSTYSIELRPGSRANESNNQNEAAKSAE